MTSEPSAPPSLAELFLPAFHKLASVQPGERVLALTVGDGAAVLEAALRSGKTGEALALDRDPARLADLSEQARRAGVATLRTEVNDGERLPGPDGYWDVALCHLGLPALADAPTALREVLRVLRPVGRLIVSAPGEAERCPFLTLLLDVVAEQVPEAREQRRRLFRYSETGRLASLLAEQGYQDAVPDRTTDWIACPDIAAYWQAATQATGLSAALIRLPAETVTACHAELERRLRFHRRREGYALKVEVVILAAVK